MESRKRRESGFSKLMSIKPKILSHTAEELVSLSFLHPGNQLPLVIQPAVYGLDLVEWANRHRDFIEAQLLHYGAILFRKFDLETVDSFERFALATCSQLFEENGELPRTNISGRIYTPVSYPADKKILWHSENTFSPRWPMKIYFFCQQPAQQGGETPIVDSRKVYQMVKPEIRDRFTHKNIMYMRNYDGALGLDWRTVFQTDSKSAAEAFCRANGIQFEWKGERLTTRAVCPAVARHPKTGEPVWFNQATHWHLSCLGEALSQSLTSIFDEERLPRHAYYGDGSSITDAEMQSICEVYQAAEVCFAWQKGDLLMLDNMLTSHARNPYAGTRKIAVALGEVIGVDQLPPLA